jgi:hypothetical protein
MITPDVVAHLKNKYGNVYGITVKNVDLIFRELTFKEYENILRLNESDDYSSADIEDYILDYSIVYPDDYDTLKIPPGIVSSLANEILDISGFSSARIAKNTLELKRLECNEVKNLMKAFVLATIYTYSPEDLEQMTFSQLAEKVALAEKIIEIKQGINGLESTNLKLQLIDPEEEEEKEKVRAARHNSSKMPGAAEYDDPIAKKLWGMN